MNNILMEHMVPMRDGVRLYTLVQLPEEGKIFPVILKRNPYADTPPEMEPFRQENTHGYAVVYQECRGTGRSEGDFIPYVSERNDGLDTLDWIRKQDFYNGEIFLEGQSYLASVHFSWLKTNQPDVKAAYLAVQDTNRYNLCYLNGFLKIGLHGLWALNMYKKKAIRRKNLTEDMLRTFPLSGITEYILGEKFELYEEEWKHPDPADPFWKTPEGGSEYANAVQESDVPILLSTGFYDIYTDGILKIWNGLTPERRKKCALYVSPYSHGFSKAQKGLPEFPDGDLDSVCPDMKYLWFDHFRKGTPLEFIRKGEAIYYSVFENKWKRTVTLENAPVQRKFYLTEKKELSSVHAGTETGKLTYLYNPFAPARFHGGCCTTFGGMQYQDPPDSRYDILSFQTEPFDGKIVFRGESFLTLHVSSTAPDTCFYARLSIVREDGTLCLRDDISSIRRADPEYAPGKEAVLRFRFAPHSYQVGKGERLRLDISSSCFPNFQIHANRVGPMSEQIGADLAWNTVLTGESVLELFAEQQE